MNTEIEVRNDEQSESDLKQLLGLRWFFRKIGLEDEVRKEERFKVSAELGECKAYLYGTNGDHLRKENPKLPKALDSICWMLTFDDIVHPGKFRKSIDE